MDVLWKITAFPVLKSLNACDLNPVSSLIKPHGLTIGNILIMPSHDKQFAESSPTADELSSATRYGGKKQRHQNSEYLQAKHCSIADHLRRCKEGVNMSLIGRLCETKELEGCEKKRSIERSNKPTCCLMFAQSTNYSINITLTGVEQRTLAIDKLQEMLSNQIVDDDSFLRTHTSGYFYIVTKESRVLRMDLELVLNRETRTVSHQRVQFGFDYTKVEITNDGRLTVSPSTDKLLFNDTVRSEMGFTNIFKLGDKDVAGRLSKVMEELSGETSSHANRCCSPENGPTVKEAFVNLCEGRSDGDVVVEDIAT
ncbi:uncharacterized protein [Amphiura filiformis]|uniref:uncharacterized protein n=1 Tax=Amphiura filiformis TaxID=82378 RepID=UPI003B224539